VTDKEIDLVRDMIEVVASRPLRIVEPLNAKERNDMHLAIGALKTIERMSPVCSALDAAEVARAALQQINKPA
jgi:hypothetical protein